jgi:hypothetical protein
MIYEMRTYHCMPGRLPALLKRFETDTLALWKKYGIRQAGFWTVVVGDSNLKLIFLIAWESMAEREQKWAAFTADPAHVASLAETQRDGPIIARASNEFLKPTAFSSVQ